MASVLPDRFHRWLHLSSNRRQLFKACPWPRCNGRRALGEGKQPSGHDVAAGLAFPWKLTLEDSEIKRSVRAILLRPILAVLVSAVGLILAPAAAGATADRPVAVAQPTTDGRSAAAQPTSTAPPTTAAPTTATPTTAAVPTTVPETTAMPTSGPATSIPVTTGPVGVGPDASAPS